MRRLSCMQCCPNDHAERGSADANSAGPTVRAERPWFVGPAGCLAVLVPGGVWLNSATPQTTPALIRPALRSSATHKGSPGPHRWPGLGNWLQWLRVNTLISLARGFLLFLWEQTMYIRRGLGANFVKQCSKIPRKILSPTFR